MSVVLDIAGLNKSFGGIKATDDLNLSVEAGELHAVIGPNGAGKTTLISQLCGTQTPDSGRIRFKGRDITGMKPYARAHLGITRSFQITSLILEMSVIDNIALAVQARDGHSFRFIRAARKIAPLRREAMALLQRVGLADKAELPTGALSHGEHRHMEIAIALGAQADLMLLDEPMAGLGIEESAEMVTLLRDLKGKHSILLIEHDMDAVFALADRISVLVYGHIIATGTPDEIRSNDAVQHAYLGEE
ncbi:ABC transporter ATP-binding protein [Antarcticimicrobium sediminis]|uniref:ABC transporter ATP-binding protein n=1 Tax=Antarcticimicrobium sediminis TaxID=2546227 RepID=A0A4R5EXW4_9RHOB|nr:ABC transporter ATP-binding protein [Antarcticimicrobium sediminis]TDE39762.1 ABC transporter ATP-binding protein [Antarcticimicrobium sediminis]